MNMKQCINTPFHYHDKSFSIICGDVLQGSGSDRIAARAPLGRMCVCECVEAFAYFSPTPQRSSEGITAVTNRTKNIDALQQPTACDKKKNGGGRKGVELNENSAVKFTGHRNNTQAGWGSKGNNEDGMRTKKGKQQNMTKRRTEEMLCAVGRR